MTSGVEGEENEEPLATLVGGGDFKVLVLVLEERASPLTLILELLRLKIPMVEGMTY